VVRGLARVLASSADAARYLALRFDLLREFADPNAADLEKRAEKLGESAPVFGDDLEEFLDSLRLFRRDETLLAAVLDLAGLVPFEKVSSFLSVLAEVVIERALAAAHAGSESPTSSLAVLGMGKLAGRELNYHSDLDLIFLLEGDASEILSASRISQRLIHYLSTPTGAGTAYAVDARLRPSGRQGMLVTTFEAYASYQLERAQTWEHLALVQCRAVAGNLGPGASLLGRVQREVRSRGLRPWSTVGDLRARIAAERTQETAGQVPIKTGEGGLMDVAFLAAGAQLERGGRTELLPFPSVAAMLSSVVRGGTVDAVIDAYHLLRRVAARARWVAGRATESLRTSPDTLGTVAELLEPGLDTVKLLEQIRTAREHVRAACESVLTADTITALES
jgi:glutamate-ammonia-ligase adenylyltransferase